VLLLTSTSDKLQVVTSAAVTVDVHASWLDNAAGTITPGRTNTAISTAATTDVVPSPGASTQRNVQTLLVRNKSTALSVDMTVRHTDGTTIVELIKCTLFVGYVLEYIDGVGFQVLDSFGNVLQTTNQRRAAPFYDAQADFGFVGDLVTVFDGAANVASNTKITSATAAFTTNAVVGQRITLAGAGAAGAQYTGTITAIDSATQVNVSPTISTTVSAKGLSFGTDNTAAITAMVNQVNNATFPGALIVFGNSKTNAYGFPTQVLFNKSCQIEGIGGGHTADTGDYTRIGGTRLAWWGTSLDGGVDFKPFFEFSPSGVQSLKRVAMRHCWLDCRNGDQNEALIGLKLSSCHGFMVEDFFVMDAAAIANWLNIDADPTEAKDTARGSFRDVCVRMLDNPAGAVTTPITTTTAVTLTTTGQSLAVAANSLPADGYIWVATNLGYPVLVRYTGGGGTTTLTGCKVSAEDAVNAPATVSGSNIVQAVPGNGTCMQLDGGTGANTNISIFEMIQLSHGTTWGPAAIELRNADSIDFIQVVINGGNATSDGAINRVRKPGVRINGSNTSDTLAARNNTFRGGSAGAGGVTVMGVLNTGARMSAMAQPNYWDLYQLGNGEPIPVVEGNTYFAWSLNGGVMEGRHVTVSVADQAVPAATLTLLTGSLIMVPPQGFQVGGKFRWKWRCSKTAAGVAARNWFIRIGTAGTTADAIVATLGPSALPTAAVDDADFEVELTIRTLGAAATAVAHIRMIRRSVAAAGFLAVANLTTEVLVGTMATFNSTTAKQFIHMSLTTGAAEAITIQSMGVECVNAANP
jgi:hypothetical protein